MTISRKVVAAVVLIAAVLAGTMLWSGSVFGGCGAGETQIGAVNDGGVANETVSVRGKYDYTLTVGDDGVTALKIDGKTGTIPVFLESAPEQDIDFGDCLRVRGVVDRAVDRELRDEVPGPAITRATVV